jgi:hypothetical protein
MVVGAGLVPAQNAEKNDKKTFANTWFANVIDRGVGAVGQGQILGAVGAGTSPAPIAILGAVGQGQALPLLLFWGL